MLSIAFCPKLLSKGWRGRRITPLARWAKNHPSALRSVEYMGEGGRCPLNLLQGHHRLCRIVFTGNFTISISSHIWSQVKVTALAGKGARETWGSKMLQNCLCLLLELYSESGMLLLLKTIQFWSWKSSPSWLTCSCTEGCINKILLHGTPHSGCVCHSPSTIGICSCSEAWGEPLYLKTSLRLQVCLIALWKQTTVYLGTPPCCIRLTQSWRDLRRFHDLGWFLGTSPLWSCRVLFLWQILKWERRCLGQIAVFALHLEIFG